VLFQLSVQYTQTLQLVYILCFIDGLGEEASSILVTKAGKKNKSKSPEQTVDTAAGPDHLVTTDGVPQSASIRVILDFKRYIYDPHKKIIQK